MSALDWKQWLSTFLAEFRQPVPMPSSETDLDLGVSQIGDDPEFVSEWLSFVAERTGAFDDYRIFLRRFRVALTPPRRPLVEPPNPKRFRAHQRHQFIEALVSFHVAFERFRRRRGEYEIRQDLLDAHSNAYSADPAGYVRFADSHCGGSLRTFLAAPQRLPILEAQRERHCLVTGTTGSGKSEIMKTMVHHYLTINTDTAIVILDPHGDFGTAVAKFRENLTGDRLVLIDLGLSDEHTPVLNPFEVGDLSPRAMDAAQQEISAQLGAVLGERASLSANMQVLLSAPIATLLRKPGATIRDLMDFVDNDHNEQLIAYGLEVLTNPAQREFLERDFANTRGDTREAVKTKLQILLQSEVFRNFLVGRSTFGLEQAIDDRKLIIFNLSRGGAGEEVAPAIGRMVMAQLMGIASKRALMTPDERAECAPIHVFIDEAHAYCTPTVRTILSEARKFRLHLTLATQYIEQFTDSDIRNSVEQNTAIKIVGLQNMEKTKAHMAKLAGTSAEKIGSLAMGEYFVKIGAFPGYTLRNDPDLIDDRNSMSEEQWGAIVADQLRRYYRPLATDVDGNSVSQPSGNLELN